MTIGGRDSLCEFRARVAASRAAEARPKITPDELEALVEAVEAAHGIYGIPQTFRSGHGESDEVTCYCGWQSQIEDYEKASAALRRHIYREERKILNAAAEKHRRLDEALAAFGWDEAIHA